MEIRQKVLAIQLELTKVIWERITTCVIGAGEEGEGELHEKHLLFVYRDGDFP